MRHVGFVSDRSLFIMSSRSVSQFSLSVMSDSSQPCGLQHTRPPCPPPPPRVYSNSSPLSQWCHPTISASVVPFSSCLQLFPASGSFQMSQLFASGGQSIGLQPQHQSFQWTLSTGSPSNFQESFSIPQFKGINYLVLSFLSFFFFLMKLKWNFIKKYRV